MLTAIIAVLSCGSLSEPSVASVPLIRKGVRHEVVFSPDAELTVALAKRDVVLWKGVPKRWKPWRVVVANLEGDSSPEIVVAVRKKTNWLRFDHNTLFVFQFDGQEVTPKWKGSSIGAEFEDFGFRRTASGDRLVLLESTIEGRKQVSRSVWNGFGFRRERTWGPFAEARLECSIELSAVADGQLLNLKE